MHEGVLFRKNNFWRNDSCENLDNFSPIRLLYMHRWCLHGPINSYYSFWWNNLILCRYNADTLNICMKEFGSQKIILTKWQLWELTQLFPYMVFVYALIVPLWANQLLPQLLMKQFDTLSIQCRHIENMHEGVYNFCLHRFYWNLLIKTKVFLFTCQVFSLTLTVRGVSNKHCLLTFFIISQFECNTIKQYNFLLCFLNSYWLIT